jgi:predicted dehydrogenase
MRGSIDRRKFLATTAAAGVGLSVAGGFSIARAGESPNERVQVAVMGVNGRGHGIARTFARQANCEVRYVCDVDSRAVERTVETVAEHQDASPRGIRDFRHALDDAELDALVIAAPDHWHAAATIMALKAGKHVYVEKPASHNPREGELLVQAQRQYGRVVQMGNQQRSDPRSIEVIEMIREGVIGRPYLARSWYANDRGSIGRGQPADVPEWLDYELWQGPAPRTPFRDNVVHYNWHWLWNWGTGEACNNGTHEIDVCRWALGVDYPLRVTSSGGRYHYEDDWEFYDTQFIAMDFEGDRTITWEGRSCNRFPVVGRDRGCSIHGTEGTVVLDRSGYEIFDAENNRVAPAPEVMETMEADAGEQPGTESDAQPAAPAPSGPDMTALHVRNFLQAIRGQAELRSPIDDAQKSVLLCHLGNIAQEIGRTLHCDTETGRVVGDPQVADYWSREYEPGWEITL